jgi:hypothetical protein
VASVNALKVIPPLVITDSILTSSNVPETDYTAWSSGTTYNIGDRVRVVSANFHKVYESLRASNLNHDPVTDTSSPPYWIEVSVTNRWKMFDTSNSTQTTNSDSIVVSITPGKVVNSVSLLNVVGTSVRVKVTDTIDGVVYDNTVSLNNNGNINNWYNYFFDPILRKKNVVLTDLPAYGTATIEITISNTGNTAKCGVCVVGNVSYIGEGIELGASVGITDYSRKEKNDFGDYVLVQRSYSKRAKFSMAILNDQIDSVQELLVDLRTTPCVWIGDSNYESTMVYGFYKDFDIVIAYHVVSDCNLEIEGLT